MSTLAPNTSPPLIPPTVATEGGTITLLDLAAMRARLTTLQQDADAKRAQAKSLQTLAQDRWAQLGRLLVESRDHWSPGPLLAELVSQAEELTQKINSDDAALEAIHIHERKGLGGVFGRVGDWSKGRGISTEQTALKGQLSPVLIQIGRQAPATAISGADTIRAQAVAADIEASTLESEAVAVTEIAGSVMAEVKQRSDSERELGFDAPYLVAYLKTYGPTPVQSPLILKKGEQASLAVPATLARQQTRSHWVGGSQGFSFPIGHTGIRYRVGSFHGHPVQQQFLGKLDTGTLVVTNQRVAFIGNVKSTSILLAKLLHVECYSDAIAVFQEGREKPDFYMVAQPKYALFMINWFLNRPV